MSADLGSIAEFVDLEPEVEDFEAAVLIGLGRPEKQLPCKFFYDQRGSRLFDQICELEEYYPTVTELKIFLQHRADIAALIGPSCHVIEFGSGSGTKIRTLLESIRNPAAYTAVDISKDHLLSATMALAEDYPNVTVTAVCADFTLPFEVSPPEGAGEAKRVGFFPGSTIGNFSPEEASGFLKGAAEILGHGGEMLIGVDLKKDSDVLLAAYNDRAGVTAEFNLNLLRRINRELGANFDLANFAHKAVYNFDAGRIEMRLISLCRQSVTVGTRAFLFEKEETIHTENSYKYEVGEFRDMCSRSNFAPVDTWVDEGGLFSVHYLRAI